MFLRNSLQVLGGAAATTATGGLSPAFSNLINPIHLASAARFNMKFSPDFGLFADTVGPDPVDQIKFGFEQGFWAWESTGLLDRSVEEQERISATMQDLGMEFGQFVAHKTFSEVTFARKDQTVRDSILQQIRDSVDVARRMKTQFVHVVLGLSDPRLTWNFQMAHATELLRRCAEIFEPHNLTMVIEPMNHRIDHPGMFLHSASQAYMLCKAVNSPSCKILFDIYHIQIQEGNVIPNIDLCWDEIGYFQIGDTPGRDEPMSGEINYKKVFQHIHDKGYRGFLGLEHGSSMPGIEGEKAVLEAYRACDPG